MKKFTLTLCSVLLLGTLSGCSDATTNVENEDKVLIQVGDSEITQGDVYTSLIATGNVNPVSEEIERLVALKAVKTTDEMKKEAEKSLASYKESVGEDKWADYLKNNGYKNDKDFTNNYILANIKSSKLQETYVNDNFEDLLDEYEPRKMEIIVITDKGKLEDAKKAIKDKKALSEVASSYGDTSTYSGKETLYTNKNGIPSMVWSEALKIKNGKTSEAIPDTNTGHYYFVKMIESDPMKFKDEAKAKLNTLSFTNEDGLTFSDMIMKYYLDELDFSVHDATVYSALLSSSKKYAKD